ncbi:MAG TPA: HalOD1 output domain-containing protein [Halobacteriales archaeon]|nr:HalOD1 output domain-containing protein [Halobacteriales archaeon]
MWDRTPVLVEMDVDEARPVSAVVVAAVAALDNRPPEELPPLHDVVDTDALSVLFEDGADDGCVVFPYCDYVVQVHADDVVSVHEPE